MAVIRAREGVRVVGLSELRRALKEAENRSPRELQQANKGAAEIVAASARRRAVRGPHEGGGTITPFAASIKAQATAGRGIVAFGGARSPHGPPIEFGGTLRRHASSARTRVRKRPAVYPAIEAERNRVLRFYEQAVDRIARDL